MSEISMTNEEWYDAEVTPKLRELANACHERGMSFFSDVEYEPGKRAGTYYLTESAGIEMHLLHIMAMTAPNIDAFLINLIRYAKEKGLDLESSMFLRNWAKK